MRKLRLVGIIIFAAWGGQSLYKYLSDDGRVFISREKLPESETVTNAPQEVPVEVSNTSMDEYYESHKNDVTEIVKKSLTDESSSMDEYFQLHKNDVASKVRETIRNKVKNHTIMKTSKSKEILETLPNNEMIDNIIHARELPEKTIIKGMPPLPKNNWAAIRKAAGFSAKDSVAKNPELAKLFDEYKTQKNASSDKQFKHKKFTYCLDGDVIKRN